jgi:hypothetical protein
MSLPYYRKELEKLLTRRTPTSFSGSEWPTTRSLIASWFDELKKWEKGDSAEAAFHDNRLTVRYNKRGISAVLDMQAAEGLGGTTKSYDFKLDVGLTGVVKRTSPGNFKHPATSTSSKLDMGLHDLNASLMDSRRKISSQFINWPKTGDLYVFMPVSQPDDHFVFLRLNQWGKKLRTVNGEFYDLVRNIRSKMTRVKLACEHDMGSNFTAYAPNNSVNPKFKYGLGAKTKTVDEATTARTKGTYPGRVLLEQEHTLDLMVQRQMNGANFRNILKGRFKYNEITIAYRQHAGDYPQFAKWDGTKFQCFKVEGDREGKACGTIADLPQKPAVL